MSKTSATGEARVVDDVRSAALRLLRLQQLRDRLLQQMPQELRHFVEPKSRPPLLAPDDGRAGLNALAAPPEPDDAARAGLERCVGQCQDAAFTSVIQYLSSLTCSRATIVDLSAGSSCTLAPRTG